MEANIWIFDKYGKNDSAIIRMLRKRDYNNKGTYYCPGPGTKALVVSASPSRCDFEKTQDLELRCLA